MAGFNSIRDESELIKHLKDHTRLNGVNFLSQYTKIGAISAILSSGFWYLGNPVNMNDLYEYNKFKNSSDWGHVFFTSFNAKQDESMAMWSMYAQPWSDGIMIKIPKSGLLQLVNNTSVVYPANPDNKKVDEEHPFYIERDSISLCRVAYVGKDTLTCTGRDDRNSLIHNVYDRPALAGFVKDAAWDYEKEVRLRIDLPSEYQAGALAIKVPEDILKEIQIIKGPRYSVKDVLTSIPRKYRSHIDIDSSIFSEKLAWIPCDGCAK